MAPSPYTNAAEKVLSQHVWMTQRISQLYGVDDLADVAEAVKLETNDHKQVLVIVTVDGRDGDE